MSSPLSPPGKRWTGDPGAIPGEPAYQLDVVEGTGEGCAALIERQGEPGRGTQWEGVTSGGRIVFLGNEFSQAARCVEQYVDWQKKLAKARTTALSRLSDAIRDLTSAEIFVVRSESPKWIVVGIENARGLVKRMRAAVEESR